MSGVVRGPIILIHVSIRQAWLFTSIYVEETPDFGNSLVFDVSSVQRVCDKPGQQSGHRHVVSVSTKSRQAE